MTLFFKKKTGPLDQNKEQNKDENKDVSEELRAYEERRRFYLSAIRALSAFIKDASLDIEELDPERFKEGIDRLIESISSEKETKKLESLFDAEKQALSSYIERQKNYLKDRETEYKDIISLLTKGMANLNAENETFNRQFYGQSEKIEKITLLDDIKEIKGALNREIERNLYYRSSRRVAEERIENGEIPVQVDRRKSLLRGHFAARAQVFLYGEYRCEHIQKGRQRRLGDGPCGEGALRGQRFREEPRHHRKIPVSGLSARRG